MAAPPHYPLTLGRIFGLGWSLFRYAWRTIIGASAAFFLPAYALMAVVTATFSPAVNAWLLAAQQAQLSGREPPPLPPGFDIAFVSLIAVGIVTFLAALAATATIIRIVDSSYRGQPISLVPAMRDGVGRLAALIVANLLFLVAVLLVVFLGVTVAASIMIAGGLAVFFGLIVLVGTVAALVFMGMRTSLVGPVVVVDRTGGADGLVRSWRLAAGSGWRILGYLVVIALVEFLLGLLLAGVPALLLRLSDTVPADVAMGTIVNGLAAILLASISPIVLTLLYYDLRWRIGETVPVPGGGETSASQHAQAASPPWGPPPL